MSNQKGALIAKNDFGTLERVDGSRTYIGSTTLSTGKVITKRFRGSYTDEKELVSRWEKWQCRNSEDNKEDISMEEKTEPKGVLCPISGGNHTENCALYSSQNGQCSLYLGGMGLWNMACNLMSLGNRDELELLALAIGDISKKLPDTWHVSTNKATKVEEQETAPLNAFLKGKTWISFVNLTSKKIHSDFKQMCAKQYPDIKPMLERNLVEAILETYPELDAKKLSNGRVFVARQQ